MGFCDFTGKKKKLWYSSLKPQNWSSVRENFRGVSPLSLTYWGTVLCLTCLCVGVPELCQGRLKVRRYWKELYCRSALKIMPCVKISDSKKDEEVDGKLLPWSRRREETGMCQTWLSPAVCTPAALVCMCEREKKKELASHYTLLHYQVNARKQEIPCSTKTI